MNNVYTVFGRLTGKEQYKFVDGKDYDFFTIAVKNGWDKEAKKATTAFIDFICPGSRLKGIAAVKKGGRVIVQLKPVNVKDKTTGYSKLSFSLIGLTVVDYGDKITPTDTQTEQLDITDIEM